MYRGAQGEYVLGSWFSLIRLSLVHASRPPPSHSRCLSPRYTRLCQLLALGGFTRRKQLSIIFNFATQHVAIKEPHEPSSCGFFYYYDCYGESLLTKVIAATDEVLVPERGFEPWTAITTGYLTSEFASQMLFPPCATPVVWSDIFAPSGSLDVLPTLWRKLRWKQYLIVFTLVSQHAAIKEPHEPSSCGFFYYGSKCWALTQHQL